MQRFWIIWTPKSSAPNPQYRHDQYVMAKEEAQRLSELYKGHEFYVAEVIGVAKAVKSNYTEMEKFKPHPNKAGPPF